MSDEDGRNGVNEVHGDCEGSFRQGGYKVIPNSGWEELVSHSYTRYVYFLDINDLDKVSSYIR